MKTGTIQILILILTLLSASICFPAEKKTVVYLHSGRIITGTLVELIPNVHVKIATSESVVQTIPFSEISYIGNELRDEKSEISDPSIYAKHITFGLFAGVALAADEFGEVNHPKSGYAMTGSIFGGEINFPLFRSFYINAMVAATYNNTNAAELRLAGIPNSIDLKTGDWSSVWLMPGIRSQASLDNFVAYASLNYGAVKLHTPFINLADKFTAATTTSVTNTHSAYSISTGVIIFEYVSLGIRYFHSKPSLPVTVMSNPELLKPSSGNPTVPKDQQFEQPISIYCFTAGFAF
ncbi:MAG: hypothetical protein ACOYNS_01305 [Bacteroidota bacterium]